MRRDAKSNGASWLLTAVAAGLMVAFFSTMASARTIDYVSQGFRLFRFDIPDDWQFGIGPDVPASEMPQGLRPAPRVISVRPPGEEGIMWTGLWSPPDVRSFDEARENLQHVIPQLLDQPQVGYSDERTVNGRAARVFSGTGSRMGRDFDFVVAVVQISAARVAMAAFIGEPGIFDRHETALVAMLDSLVPLGGAR